MDNEINTIPVPFTFGDFKANIVTYSISKLISIIKEKNDYELNLIKVWEKQTAAGNLLEVLIEIAKQVQDLIQDTPEGQKNVTQYCKQEACWKKIDSTEFEYDVAKLNSCLRSSSEAKEERKEAKKLQKSDDKLLGQAYFFAMPSKEWNRIIEFSKKNQISTFKEEKYMKKLKWDPSKLKSSELQELNDLMNLIKSYHFESQFELEE